MKRLMARILIAAVAAALVAAAVLAVRTERLPVRALASVSRTTVLIGDTVTYTLEVRVRNGVEADLPDLGGHFNGFTMLDWRRTAVAGNARTTYRYRYDLACAEPGAVEIAPVRIRYRRPGETGRRVAESRGFTITVKGLLGAPRASKAKVTIGGAGLAGGRGGGESGPGRVMEVETTFDYDIRELDGPRTILTPRDRLFIAFFAAGGVIIIIVLLSFVYDRVFRRKTPPPPPWDVALEAARRLQPKAACATGDVKSYYGELDAILKRYLRARFGMAPLEKTTREFLAELAAVKDIDPALPERVGGVLRVCDLVKYSSYGSREAELTEKRDAVIALIQETTPA